MTVRQAERITGLVIRSVGNEYALFLSEQAAQPLRRERVRVRPGIALSNLVEWNYARMRAQVFAEQEYRCWSCFRIAPLQCDHIRPRSHGRSDSRLNLRALCATCHDLQTRNYPITMDPRMGELMAKRKLRWYGEWSPGCESYGWQTVICEL